jgi:hypothetical protein
VGQFFCRLVHLTEPIVKHACSNVVPTKNNTAVDDITEAAELKKRLIDMIIYRYCKDKKQGKGFTMQQQCMKAFNITCSMLLLPNSMHVLGFYYMLEDLLKHKSVFKFLSRNCPENMKEFHWMVFMDKEWNHVVELQAVLCKMMVLSINFQNNTPGHQSLTTYKIYATIERLFGEDKVFECIDATAMWRLDAQLKDMQNISK